MRREQWTHLTCICGENYRRPSTFVEAAEEWRKKHASHRTDALTELRNYLTSTRDFNEKWIALHMRDGHPDSADHRREIVAQFNRWLAAFDGMLRETYLATCTNCGAVAKVDDLSCGGECPKCDAAAAVTTEATCPE